MHSLNMSKIILFWGLTVMWGYACIGLDRNVPEITKGHLCPRQRVDNRIDRIGNKRMYFGVIWERKIEFW